MHVMSYISKKVAPVHVIETVKKESSKFVKTLGYDLKEFSWQTGYALFGVSQSHVDTLRWYIQQQEEHHKVESFQDEYRRLLTDAGIEFDENYLWSD